MVSLTVLCLSRYDRNRIGKQVVLTAEENLTFSLPLCDKLLKNGD